MGVKEVNRSRSREWMRKREKQRRVNNNSVAAFRGRACGGTLTDKEQAQSTRSEKGISFFSPSPCFLNGYGI